MSIEMDNWTCASYGNSYVTPDDNNADVLWLNEGNDNHWIAFDLEGFESNLDAVGAKVTLIGDFGTMVREIRGGESYGITCTFACRFGLGDHESVDQAVVQWPSGSETVVLNPAIDQYHNVLEVPCVDVVASANAVSFCPGEVVTLSANEGFRPRMVKRRGDSLHRHCGVSTYPWLCMMPMVAEEFQTYTVSEIVGNTPTISLDVQRRL